MEFKLPRHYTRPLKIALGVSVLAHVLFGMGLANALYQHSKTKLGVGPAPEPLIINLQPQRKPEKRLVEAPVPVDVVPNETDLIAEEHSAASDLDEEVAGDEGPRVEEAAEYEQLASAVPTTPPAAPAEAASEEAIAESEPREESPAPPVPEEASAPEPVRSEPRPMTRSVPRAPATQPKPETEPFHEEQEAADAIAEGDKAGAAEATSELLEPFQVAKAAPLDAVPGELPKRTVGKPKNSAIGQGFTSFDAIRDEIAPYLKNIKMRVEARWRQGIEMRYNGTRITEATVDCAIDPQGNLVLVEVVGTPDDRLFAAICQQAIERAGPFGPFTFEVPDMYRNKNLEIRWTFSFLR